MLKIKFFLFLFYNFSNFLCQFSNFNSFPRAGKLPLRSASSIPASYNFNPNFLDVISRNYKTTVDPGLLMGNVEHQLPFLIQNLKSYRGHLLPQHKRESLRFQEIAQVQLLKTISQDAFTMRGVENIFNKKNYLSTCQKQILFLLEGYSSAF